MKEDKKQPNVSALYEALAVNNGLPVPLEALGPAFATEEMIRVLVKGRCLREVGGRLWVNVVKLGAFFENVEAGYTVKESGSRPVQSLGF